MITEREDKGVERKEEEKKLERLLERCGSKIAKTQTPEPSVPAEDKQARSNKPPA
ncbi:MAG TPA: hypothetical protein VMU07_03725 [Candidatus Paceibacterota bacterium]|nr:hypothetical protein [Candidatus Paceibacterota bacterium]